LLASQIAVDAGVELGRPGVALSEDAMAALRSHAWPGNVRELQNCLRQAVAPAAAPLLKREDLRLPAPERRGAVEPGAEPGDTAAAAVAAWGRGVKTRPGRHFRCLGSLVRQHFDRRPSAP